MLPYGYCAVTCGRCSSSSAANCYDVQPPGGYSCTQQAGWGKCGAADVMMPYGYCGATCRRCTSGGGSSTTAAGAGSSSPSPSSSPSDPYGSLLGSLNNWLFAAAAAEDDSAEVGSSAAADSSSSPSSGPGVVGSDGTFFGLPLLPWASVGVSDGSAGNVSNSSAAGGSHK
eukprot:XP_001702172.1 predicted protein [Chlamydomonas reinhardtii]